MLLILVGLAMNITLESLTGEQWGLESSNGTVNEEAGGEQNYVAMFRGT